MPSPTYTPLANITLGSSAASVTFSSISQAYRDLVLVVTATSSSGTGYPGLRFNSDTSTSYYLVSMSGNGSTASSSTGGNPSLSIGWTTSLSSTERWQSITNIMDYSVTDKHKSILVRSDRAGQGTEALAARWINTAAITTLLVKSDVNNFASGSTFALYGVAA